MESLKFAKIDYMKIMSQLKVMLLFSVVALLIQAKMDTYYWALIYMAFGGVVLVTTPFFSEILTERGFFILLPSKAAHRVRGRYLFGASFLLNSVLAGSIITVAVSLAGHYEIPYFVQSVIIIYGACLLLNSIQFLVLSFTSVKNAQVLSLMRLVVPFIIFFGGNAVSENVFQSPEDAASSMLGIASFVMDRINLITVICLAAGVLVTIICCEVSVWKEERRDG